VCQLARAGSWRPRLQLARGELLGRCLKATDTPPDPCPEEQGGGERSRCRSGGDSKDLDVVVHVEHDQTPEDHRGKGEADSQQRQPGKLQAHRRKQPQCIGERDPRGERAQRDQQSEIDHGVNR